MNISLVFISQSYFTIQENMKLNVTHYLIIEKSNKWEIKETALNCLSDTDCKDLMKLCKDYTKEPYSFLVNDITLLSVNPLKLRKNLL